MAANTLNILKPSVNNLTVRIFVRAAGLEFEEQDVWGKTTTPEYLDKYPAQGVTPAGLGHTWDPDVTAGSLTSFGAGDVALSEVAADQLGVRPGSSLKLTLGDGTPTTLKVTAVYARGLGFGDLTMAHALVARHVDNPLAATVLVKTDRTKDQLSKALTKFPNVQVKAPSAVGTLQAERGQANAEVNHVAMGLILAFTAIAVVNTFAMSISERAREFALLRLAGATRRQVLRMLRTEALAVLPMVRRRIPVRYHMRHQFGVRDVAFVVADTIAQAKDVAAYLSALK